MDSDQNRRWFLRSSVAAGAVALAGCSSADDDDEPEEEEPEDTDEPDEENGDEENGDEDEVQTYEIWAADQGLDNIYVYEGEEGSSDFEYLESIDVSTTGGRPHMVHYTSDYAYAAIANAGGPVVIDTETKEIVAEAETGDGSHFAGFTPDDEALIVDVIGDNKIVKVDFDHDEEELTIEDEIVPSDEIEDIEDTQNPVCHSYDHQGRSIHTLGPAYAHGGVVIVDHDDFSIDVAWPGEDVQANCGTIPHPTENKFYLTAGAPSDPDDDDADGVGYYYVLDTEEDEVIKRDSAEGIDTHGFWYTTDGEELWVLNRETNDGIVLDPETDDQIDTVDAYGEATGDEPETSDAPDIMWASPDGEWMFVTLRGPEPVSGGPHAATGVTPGFSVLDTETKQIETVVEPDPIEDYTEEELADEDTPTPDFHGIGVRPVGEFDVTVGTPPY